MIIEELVYQVKVKADEFLNGKKKVEQGAEALKKKTEVALKQTGKNLSGLTSTIGYFGKVSGEAFKGVQWGLTKFLGLSIGIEATRRLFLSTTDTLVGLSTASTFLGISGSALDGWRRQAQAVGSSGEEVTGVLLRLNNARNQLAHPVPGQGPDLDLVNFNARTKVDLFGSKDPGDMLVRLARGLRELPKAEASGWSQRLGIDPALFEAMRDPTLENQVRHWTSRSNVTEEAQKRALEVKKTLTELSQAAQNVGNDLLVAFGPEAIAALKAFSTWVTDHKDSILAFFHDGAALAKKFSDSVGGVSNAITFLGGVWGASKLSQALTGRGLIANTAAGVAATGAASTAAIAATRALPWLALFYPSSTVSGTDEMHELARLKKKNLAANSTGVNQYAPSATIKEHLLDAIKQTESGGNPNAVSHAGARGPYQFMPATGRDLGLLPHELGDPEKSRAAAEIYISQLLKRYQGDVSLALMAYNAGPGRIDNWLEGKGKPLAQETLDYPGKVFDNYRNMTAYATRPKVLPTPQNIDSSQSNSTYINTVNVTAEAKTVDQLQRAIEAQARRSRMNAAFSNGMY